MGRKASHLKSEKLAAQFMATKAKVVLFGGHLYEYDAQCRHYRRIKNGIEWCRRQLRRQYSLATRLSGSYVRDVLTEFRATEARDITDQLGELPAGWIGPPGMSPGSPESIYQGGNTLVNLDRYLAGDPVEDVVEPATPDWFSLTTGGCQFQPTARPPARWLEFLEEAIPDPADRDKLQAAFGYCLTHDTSLQVFFVLLGPSGTGKSTILRVLEGIVGEGNFTARGSYAFSKNNRFSLARTEGQLVLALTETSFGAVSAERLNAYVSGEKFELEYKFENPVACRPTARVWMTSNDMSWADPGCFSPGLLRRLVRINVTGKPRRVDPNLLDKLLYDAHGILRWAIEGRRKRVLLEWAGAAAGGPTNGSSQAFIFEGEQEAQQEAQHGA